MLTNTFYLWKILLSGKFSGKKAISNRSSHWFNAIINSPQVSRRLIGAMSVSYKELMFSQDI
jgi:hypothetical protein